MKLNIRTRLAISFTLIVSTILILFSAGIYYFSSTYREAEFYTRLREKALTTAQLLIKVDEVSLNLLRIIDRNTVNAMYDQHVVVYAANDTLMYSSSDRSGLDVSQDLLQKVKAEKEIHYHTADHEAIGLIYENDGTQFVILASALDRYGKSKLKNLKWVLVLGFIGSIALTIFASLIYAGRALKPMLNVVNQVDQITIANLDVRVDEGNGDDEISALAITFNKMLHRLESAFYMQRSFVSNASHELRTPLTAITSQIEVTLMKQRPREEYEAILNSVLEDIKNLNTLSNGLLDLAKVSSDLSSIQVKPLRIDELLWVTRTDLVKRHADYNIEILFNGDIDDERKLQIVGNEQLLRTAILNMMDNGCKYSRDQSIKVSLDISLGNIQIIFEDHGIGIRSEDMVNIFAPFFRAYNARHMQGHGLGLSLTEKIIQLHEGTINVQSTINVGTTITINLPAMTPETLPN